MAFSWESYPIVKKLWPYSHCSDQNRTSHVLHGFCHISPCNKWLGNPAEVGDWLSRDGNQGFCRVTVPPSASVRVRPPLLSLWESAASGAPFAAHLAWSCLSTIKVFKLHFVSPQTTNANLIGEEPTRARKASVTTSKILWNSAPRPSRSNWC